LVLLVLGLGTLLSIPRDAVRDDALYLQDAAIMAQCLSEGRWFGDEPVGLHGFLFKLPAALLFLLTGPNVTIATFITILFAMLAIWLCFLIFHHITGSANWAAAGILLILASYHFLDTQPTFLREIPALLAVLFLIHGLVRRKGDWWMAAALFLVLDAKEMVYFLILPGLCAWIVWQGLRNKEWKSVTLRLGFCFLPLFITIIPMFFTGLIPLNPRLPFIMGLHKGGILQAMHWKFTAATFPAGLTPGIWADPSVSGVPAVTWFWSLLVQIFGPKGFSLVSIPKFIIVPAIAMGIRLQNQWIKSPLPSLAVLPFITWPYLALIVITRSSGRHLFPIAPILFIFFILFIRDGIQDVRFFKHTFAATSIIVALEMFFPHPQQLMNIAVQAVVLLLFWIYYSTKRSSSRLHPITTVMLIAAIIVSTSGSAIAASYLLPGQMGRALIWGRLGEMQQIAEYIPSKTPVWINANPLLASFYTHQDFLPPKLDKKYYKNFFHIPKSLRLKRSHPQLIHSFPCKSPQAFLRRLRKKKINTILLVVSTAPNKKFRFPHQDLHSYLGTDPNFTLQSTIPFKNKQLHIFKLKSAPFHP
jgi:hypothetical protein